MQGLEGLGGLEDLGGLRSLEGLGGLEGLAFHVAKSKLSKPSKLSFPLFMPVLSIVFLRQFLLRHLPLYCRLRLQHSR